MSKLHNLQQNFEAHILNADEMFTNQVLEPIRGNAGERLAVYANGYRWRLLEALGKDYEMLQRYIGDDAFMELGERYIDKYPSKYFSIADFGKHVPQFLATETPYNQQPYLGELATFIRALSSSLETENAEIITVDNVAPIAQEDWPDMHFKFHSSVRLLNNQWNVTDIWQALVRDSEPSKPVYLESVYCVIWRKDIQAYYCNLNDREVWMLKALQDDRSFGEICEGLTQWLSEEEVAQYAVNLLVRWIKDGMFIEVNIHKS